MPSRPQPVTVAGFGVSATMRRLSARLRCFSTKALMTCAAELSRVVAPVAVLPKHRDDDVGIAARSHADKPRIRHRLVSAAGAGNCVMAHDLRRTGLAGEVDAFQVRGSGGAGRA